MFHNTGSNCCIFGTLVEQNIIFVMTSNVNLTKSRRLQKKSNIIIAIEYCHSYQTHIIFPDRIL